MKLSPIWSDLAEKDVFRGVNRLVRVHLMWLIFTFVVLAWLGLSWIVYHFEIGAQGSNITSFGESAWWGIVTLLTVGYGDRYPISWEGRIFACFLMIAGVTSMGVLTAKISSFFLERAILERKGYVDTNLLMNHFIVCGWKPEMHSLLLHILDSNSSVSAENIVLVNSVDESHIEELMSHPRLHHIKMIRGDFFTEVALKRAACSKAKKILILADATPNSQGQIPTVTEADARTIMAAMTLSNIAKGVTVIAEILDSTMDQYLRLAHVQEIIYSRDYSRMLMAMASSGTGVTNVIHDLLSPSRGCQLTTKHIPENHINQKFSEFKGEFSKHHPNILVIGILENSGNIHSIKEGALKKAQKTPNVAQLVQNLQALKALRFNNPVFNPDSEYIIQEGALAIVLENSKQGASHHVGAA